MHTEYILATSRSYNNILYERMIIIIIYTTREYIMHTSYYSSNTSSVSIMFYIHLVLLYSLVL